jgi:hypothetical protein
MTVVHSDGEQRLPAAPFTRWPRTVRHSTWFRLTPSASAATSPWSSGALGLQDATTT